MKPISSPWALVRHMWTRNFQVNPVGTVVGTLLAVAGVGLLMFFGFFVFMALFVVGGLLMLANALFGTPRRQGGWPASGRPYETGPKADPASVRKETANSSNNKALEGEYTVVPDQKSERNS